MKYITTYSVVYFSGYIGCHADVMDIIDGSCSGKQHCEFTVWSNLNEREDLNPCKEGLEKYLAAGYMCVAGMFLHTPYGIFNDNI